MNTILDTVTNEHSETADLEDKAIGRLKELLDSEIEHIRSGYEQSGYTKWALFVGIASIVWLIIDRIEQGSFSTKNVGILFLAISLAFSVLLSLSNLSESAQLDPSIKGRFRLTNRWFALNRASLLLFLTHIISVILIAYSVRDLVIWPFTVSVCVVYGIEALMLVVIYFMTYIPFPLALSQANPTISIMINLVLIVGSFIPLIAYMYHIASSSTVASVDDYRIAALIFAVYYLLRTLVGLRSQTPILESLVTTRRDLLLGRMDVTTATQQIDIALAGMQVSDILHEDVRGLLELLKDFSAEINQASKKAKTIRAIIENVEESGEEVTEQDVSIIEALVESIDTHIDKSGAIEQEMNQQTRRLFRKVMLFFSSSKETRAASGKVFEPIIEVANKVSLQLEELKEEFETIKLVWDTLDTTVEEGNVSYSG